jgi:ATP-dependent helicase/nuclease subunit B
VRVILSSSAAARLAAARAFLGGRPPGAEVVIVGASRGAADDLAREIARRAGATFGLTRFSLTELAARAAAARLAGARRVPGSTAGAEAIAARAVFDAVAAGELTYFAPVASLPGFPKALARTVHELRLAGVTPAQLAAGATETSGPDGTGRPPERTAVVRASDPLGSGGAGDLSALLTRVEEQLAHGGVDDRAALFRLAAAACHAKQVRWAALPIVLLDVPLDSRAEQEFAAALVAAAPDVLATAPDDDRVALAALAAMGGTIVRVDDDAPPESDLAHLRRHVFRADAPPVRDRTGDVRLFSAPGEGREAVEIVRRILDEAARGVRFDEMAVLLRTPRQYLGLLEHACARGDVPVYFDRGTRRPDPAGRAFIALLACAVEGLSAKRFDEYLSLGQVPRIASARGDGVVGSPDSPGAALLGAAHELVDQEQPDDAVLDPDAAAIDSDDEAVIAGTLRSPWKWEELIVESAVVGGRTRADGSARWRRRLDGLKSDYQIRIAELRKEEPESARIARYERDLANLVHLRRFALPVVDALAAWPEQAIWGEWLERFTALANATLGRPARVLQVLADLRPMAAVGPVTLEEARDVLHDRLVTLDWEPPARRYGRVFVGTPHQARGRTFRVAFVPGLAERIVPQRPREDPLLLDGQRRAIDPGLVDQEQRGSAERLLLKIAIGAAGERLYLSYPRLDVAETRARVPSFYALDVIRAITGRVPDHRVLASEAAEEGGASLAWPAPKDPDRAIDDLEHDLAVLEPLLQAREPALVKGRAHYMLGLNDALRRSVISRWARGRGAWSPNDGLIRVSPSTEKALAAQRLRQRAYSLSALQRFATCPYQFLLATIFRLEPWDEPEPLVRMDPLTRGSLFHTAQAEFYRAMDRAGALPVTRAQLPAAVSVLEQVVERVAADYAERLAPAIERVWHDEIDELRRDLGIWVQKLADDQTWRPLYFEYSFGLDDEGRDPHSVPDPILIDGKYILRGSVDLVEHRADLDVLRVTDHKTGRNRATPDLIVGGGTMLQGVLYSVAVEQALGKKVVKGRYYYATTAGGFADKEIEINDYSRGQGLQVLAIVDRAIESGFLAAAPAERACTWCDFRPVCGPREEERTRRKAREKLADLEALRGLR